MKVFVVSVFCFMLSYSNAENNITKVKNLRCEYSTNPIGLDIADPRFSWTIESEQRGIIQISYQIIVSSSEERLSTNDGDVWNSGKVFSNASAGIVYCGPELKSRHRYFWKVVVSTNKGQTVKSSEQAFFEMGLLKPEDWISGWIAYVPGMPGKVLYFKSTIHNPIPVKRARTYISGLGYYEMFINKKKVGNRVLEPAQSTYSKRVYYSTYDVTSCLTEGPNVVVVSVAPGWYGTPSLKIQLEIEYSDGSRKLVTSDNLRHVTTGPVVFSSLFDGEGYDARLETPELFKPDVPSGLMNQQETQVPLRHGWS